MKPFSERIKSFPADQFIDWLCLACVDVRQVRTEEDAQDEINNIRDAVTERLSALEARVKAAEDAADKYLHEAKRHQRALLAAEAELARLKAQEPVDFRWRWARDENAVWTYCHMDKYNDAVNAFGDNAIYEKVYAAPRPAVLQDYENLKELYHAQEERLFKIAQQIKGVAFDKYAHSPSQAIDVLEQELGCQPQRIVVTDGAFNDGLNALNDCLDDCGDSEQGLRLALRAIQEAAGGEIAE